MEGGNVEDEDRSSSDSSAQGPPVQRQRLDVQGNAVPGSQDAVLAERTQALSLQDPQHAVQGSVVSGRRRRSRARASSMLRCAQCVWARGRGVPSA